MHVSIILYVYLSQKKSQRNSAGCFFNVIASPQAGIAYIKELQNGHGVCAVSANYAADLKRGWADFEERKGHHGSIAVQRCRYEKYPGLPTNFCIFLTIYVCILVGGKLR